MNIFAFDPDPEISASYHCDQHLHKMILESAQMVSTAMIARGFNLPYLYKSAYPNHPCTKWAASSNHNILWLCELAFALDDIRQSVSNCGIHASIHPIKLARDYIQEEFPYATHRAVESHVFCGPAIINIRPWDVHQKYREYYRAKHLGWMKEKGSGMTWKNREVPEFMADLIQIGRAHV